jgi:hypothetical protein
MIMGLRKFEVHLLAALASHPSCSSDPGANLKTCANESGLSWLPGWIDHAAQRLAIDKKIRLIKKDYNVHRIRGDIDSIDAQITEYGLAYLKSNEAKSVLANKFSHFKFTFPKDSVDWYILSALLSAVHTHENEGYLTADEIIEKSEDRHSGKDIRNRLNRFIRSGFVKIKTGKKKPPSSIRYTLTAQGVWFVIQHTPSIFDLGQWPHATHLNADMIEALDDIWDWDRALHTYLDRRTSQPSEDVKSIPASDRIVSINHNSPEYRQAIHALQGLLEKAPKDNSFCTLVANEEDRAVILSEWKSALDWLGNKKVRVTAFASTIIPTLLWIAKELASGTIGALAATAVEAIKKLIGL